MKLISHLRLMLKLRIHGTPYTSKYSEGFHLIYNVNDRRKKHLHAISQYVDLKTTCTVCLLQTEFGGWMSRNTTHCLAFGGDQFLVLVTNFSD
jgi:hypothetical protein